MVVLEKIVPSMFPDIYQSFLACDDPHSTEADWRRLFFYGWAGEGDHFGYALVDGGSVVGVLGMVFSERQVDGELRGFCNLHTWHVKEAYRGRSLALMRPAMALRDHVLTDFSSTERVRAISKRLGFDDLDCTLKILLPARERDDRGAAEVCAKPEAFEDYLSPADFRLYRDHKDLDCGHLLLADSKQYCYVIYSLVSRRRLPYCYLHYVSNREAFARHSVRLRNELTRRTGARYLAVDARRVAGLRLPLSFTFPVRCHQLMRGSRLNPAQIDTLYSEVLMLNLCTFPDLTHKLRQFARRFGLGARFGGDTGMGN